MSQRYAKTKVDGRSVSTHRAVWEAANGPIPEGYVVHHINHDKLDNRLENLALMTHEEHSRHHNDKHPRVKRCAHCGSEYEPHATKRSRSVTCSRECFRAHMSKVREGRGKLTEDRVRDARQRFAAGERLYVLAAEFGVSQSALSQAINGKTWGHVR